MIYPDNFYKAPLEEREKITREWVMGKKEKEKYHNKPDDFFKPDRKYYGY